jgi:hypothetical protein
VTAKLIHVGVVESSARRFLKGETPPDWFEKRDNKGLFAMQPWSDDQVMVMLTAQMVGEEHAVKVQIGALYEFVNEDPPSESDAIRKFFIAHTEELVPFLRQAVHAASSQVWPIRPIMMDTVHTDLRPAEATEVAGSTI